MNLTITFEYVPDALRLMAMGMGGIFIALFALYLVSVLLLKVFPVKKED